MFKPHSPSSQVAVAWLANECDFAQFRFYECLGSARMVSIMVGKLVAFGGYAELL